jgi:hypothetical protein
MNAPASLNLASLQQSLHELLNSNFALLRTPIDFPRAEAVLEFHRSPLFRYRSGAPGHFRDVSGEAHDIVVLGARYRADSGRAASLMGSGSVPTLALRAVCPIFTLSRFRDAASQHICCIAPLTMA